MLLTIALSGMDNATDAALRSAFSGANAHLGGHCALVPEAESQHVIVDMDSMYGPMSWLRLHAAGKQVIGLTSAPRVQTHFRLARPFDEQAMITLLVEVADSMGVRLDTAAAPTTATTEQAAGPDDQASGSTPKLDAVTPGVPSDEPATAPRAPEPAETIRPSTPPAGEPLPPTPADVDADMPSAAQAGAIAPLRASASGHEAGHDRPLLDWLEPGVLQGRHRYRNEAGPDLLIDFDARCYHGPTTLKPLAPHFSDQVAREAFASMDADSWQRDAEAAGVAQPLSRLRWLGALVTGDGDLAPGYDPEARYILNKWPQTEREYPRHFRIATAMMKGPATLAEITAASGLTAEDIHRFVNASLATGYAEPVTEAGAERVETPKASGFLSRLRLR